MADFELEDSQGNRYRIRRGAGPQFWHSENLAGGSTLLADELLCNVPVSSIDAAHNHFYSDVLTSLPNRQSSPQGALSDALSSSHLTIEKIGTALVISDDVPDPRNELIVKIRNALATIVAGERAEAAMHTRLLDEENTLTKSMIYTGAFMQGIGSSAWGMVVWLKEVSDVVNPFVKMQHHAKALQAAWESEDFSKTYADTYVKGEKRELVEAIGFDPSAITEQQIDEAMAMTSLVMDDPNVRGMLYQFTKDYAEAQHAIEVTNVIGSAVFEIILAIVMAAVTGGVGVVAAVGSKAHLIKKFQKVGDLLQDFAKATRSLKSQAKKRKTKGNQNAALPVEKVEAKKTDAHGAEDGNISAQNDQIQTVEFEDIYSKAPAAKIEIDSIADEVAANNGGTVAKAPIKSKERSIEKIIKEYEGDPSKIKDLARNTIIVPPEKINTVAAELAQRGAKVKVINGRVDPLGYSGVNSTLKTETGITAEIQVNSPEMIYAKEPESVARSILGDDSYEAISEKSSAPGGKGHELYEEWRSLPDEDPGRPIIEAQSKSYYDSIRKSNYAD